MRVVDCFIYGGETKLLELRLNLLKSVVDCFVVVEGEFTFTGSNRDISGEAILQRHLGPDFNYRYVLVSDYPEGNAWVKEAHQRNAIMRGLVDAHPDDLLLISDVDEIPNPAFVKYLRESGAKSGNLEMIWHSWAYNLAYKRPQMRAKVLRMSQLTTPQEVRDTVMGVTHANAGWHLSWMMGTADAQSKIASFSHTELNRAAVNNANHIQRCITQGVDLIGRELLSLIPAEKCAPNASQFGLQGSDFDGLFSVERVLLLLESAGRKWLPPRNWVWPRLIYVVAGLPRVFVTRSQRRLVLTLNVLRRSGGL